MAQLLRVPEVAAGATEVVLLQWLLAEGTEATAGAPIAVVETEKATVEIESEVTGVLLLTLVEPGAAVEVGAPVALFGTTADVGREAELLAELGASAPESRPAPPRRDVPEPEAESPTPGPASPAVEVEVESEARQTEPEPVAPGKPPRIFITPLARKLLRQSGLEPENVRGTGPHGRITRRDADRTIAERKAAPAPAPGPAPKPAPAAKPSPVAVPADVVSADGDREPHSRQRKAVASRLTQSKRDVPHFYLKRTAVIDELIALRAGINEHASVKVSVNDLIIRAVATAHVAVPEVNAIWTDEATVRFGNVDVSVAVAASRGLVTPVVRGVQERSLSSISGAVRDFVTRANAGTLQQHELEGGSITVTNLGMFGVEEFAAIINPPQSCILAVGAGRQAPIVRAGELGVATQLGLVLSVDHRVVDGAVAARWFDALVGSLEQPFRLVV